MNSTCRYQPSSLGRFVIGLVVAVGLGAFALKQTPFFRLEIRAANPVQPTLEDASRRFEYLTWTIDNSQLIEADWSRRQFVFDAQSIDSMPQSQWIFATGNEFAIFFGDSIVAEGFVVNGITARAFDSPILYIDDLAHFYDETRYRVQIQDQPSPSQLGRQFASIGDLRPEQNAVLSVYFRLLSFLP